MNQTTPHWFTLLVFNIGNVADKLRLGVTCVKPGVPLFLSPFLIYNVKKMLCPSAATLRAYVKAIKPT